MYALSQHVLPAAHRNPSRRHAQCIFLVTPNNTASSSHMPRCLRVLLAAQASGAVGQVDVQLLGALHDGLALQGGDVVRDLSGVPPAGIRATDGSRAISSGTANSEGVLPPCTKGCAEPADPMSAAHLTTQYVLPRIQCLQRPSLLNARLGRSIDGTTKTVH